ncbi:MAG: pyrroline-5-carboxylate reductase [Deferribacterota bacterium]|nr:pyrroline-5-carboxylate reductase [Deferribacterota bacterium]
MLNNDAIGIIGAGNIGSAIIKGLINSRIIDINKIYTSDTNKKALDNIKQQYKINTTHNNIELIEKSTIVFLAVKPQIIDSVLNEIKDKIKENYHLIISVAAGITINYLEKLLCKNVKIIRCMTNTPALVLEAATVLTPNIYITKKDIEKTKLIFSSIGEVVEVNENLLDAVTGLSGSGPAYMSIIIEALSDGGVKMGLSREIATKLAIQTMLGSAKLLKETNMHPARLKDMVTSPGGTTIDGICALEKGGIRINLIEAVLTATNKSKKLGEK